MTDSSWLGLLIFPAIALLIAIAIIVWTMPRKPREKDRDER